MIDPEVARERASVASNARWAKETDRTAATEAMRAGILEKHQREARKQLGPDATDEEVAKAADNSLRAHYARMRLNSLLSRQRAARERRRAEAEAIADAIMVESGADDTAA